MASEVFKSGFVALIGRPNAGKSTLLNSILKEKVSIVSAVPQTTRHLIRGVLTTPRAQIVFVDSPGIHSFRNPLAKKLNTVARSCLDGIDLVLYVVDVTRSCGREEERIMSLLIKSGVNSIMVLNKIDCAPKYLNEHVDTWRSIFKRAPSGKDPVRYYIPLSARTGKNLEALIGSVTELLPGGEPFYETGVVTDFPLRFRIADIIREKILLLLKEELPHSAAVEVTALEEKERATVISGCIYVNRNSQKKIVVGKRGSILKEIGTCARKDIESVLKARVYLELWVKVVPDWQEKLRILQELGYGS